MKWHKKSNKVPQNIDELQAIVLKNRSIPKKDVDSYLNPINPTDLKLKDLLIDKKELTESIKLIKKNIKDDNKIVIFGDYDVDGISASAILWQVLFELYKKEHKDGINHPVPFIPHREKHGYGISLIAIDEIIEAHSPKLIITVDNGIVAFEPIKYARQKGIDIILTDHHQPEKNAEKDIFPDANHIVHTTKLCGATVAWIIANQLDTQFAQSLLDLAGIATIADQVPLLGANRSFATYGIRALRKSNNIGIKQLCDLAKVNQAEINEGSVGFKIAPRINAMGRLEHGLDALRLLCTKNKQQAKDLANLLQDTNSERQNLTKDMLSDARSQVDAIVTENIIIVQSQDYHEGILGLIAGGLAERYNKPAIAICMGKDLAKASARSIQGINIVEMLREVRDELTAVGGHPMAAGFSFLPEKFESISSRLFQIANDQIKKSQLEKFIDIDCEIPSKLVSVEPIVSLSKFAPYGMKNEQPIFEVNNLIVLDVKHIGKDNEHLKLKVQNSEDESETSFDCLGWRMSEYKKEIKTGNIISIVGNLDINEWRDRKYPQMILKDLELS